MFGTVLSQEMSDFCCKNAESRFRLTRLTCAVQKILNCSIFLIDDRVLKDFYCFYGGIV